MGCVTSDNNKQFLYVKRMNLINYINSLHNLNASGVNALAESQVNSSYFQDIYTPFPIIENLKQLIKGHNNNIIVLTGHAGDGKSTIAFNLLQELDKSYSNKPFKEYEYLESHDLHILKDMSELNINTRREHLNKAFGSKTPTLARSPADFSLNDINIS